MKLIAITILSMLIIVGYIALRLFIECRRDQLPDADDIYESEGFE